MTETDLQFLRSLPPAATDTTLATPGTILRGVRLEAITRCDLDDVVLDAEATALTPMLRELGITSVIYECCDGWTTIPVDRIPEVLTSDLAPDQFTPWVRPYGTIDQTFRSTDPLFELEFCHESQVHVRANDPALIEPFWARWRESGLAFARRIDEEWFWEDE